MDATNSLLAVVYAIQLLGLVSVVLSRLVSAGALLIPVRAVFFGSLVLIGIATMLAISAGSGEWLPLGTTLSVMVIGAVVDVGRTRLDFSI